MALPIIFYDIPSKLPINAWSPNTWKTRYALNIKGVPYKTEWVEYPDIEALAIKIRAPPTGTNDGKPAYTLPIINDPNTGKVISDSFLIAEYLDDTYPDGPALFPPGTKPLIQAWEAGVVGGLGGIVLLQLAVTCGILNAPSEKYFRTTREAKFGMKIEEFSPEGSDKRKADLAKGKEGLAALDGWLAISGGKYVMGNTVSYADGILAGWLAWVKITGDIWGEVSTWHNGRWETYLANVESYAKIN